jgi:hypothetical protein
MSQPPRSLAQLGQAGTLLAADQGQQLRAFALGLRRTGILRSLWRVRLLPALARLARCGCLG